MDELATFASDIRGTERDELMRTTSPLDIHDVNTSSVDPEDLLRGVDTRGDNDGLFQRFNNSCAPTVAQVVAAEADPVLALRLHQDGLDSLDPSSRATREQERMLESNGGGAKSRMGIQAFDDVDMVMSTLTLNAEKDFSKADSRLVRRYLKGEVDDKEGMDVARELLQQVREYNDGHPTETEVQAMLRDIGHEDKSMWIDNALNEVTTPATGIEYDTTRFEADELDEIERRLVEGEDVPFSIRYRDTTDLAGHAMSMVDVRHEDDGRCFLVHDPWSGATRWVEEPALLSGDFTRVFGLSDARINIYQRESE